MRERRTIRTPCHVAEDTVDHDKKNGAQPTVHDGVEFSNGRAPGALPAQIETFGEVSEMRGDEAKRDPGAQG